MDGMEDGIRELLWMMVMYWVVWRMKSVESIVLPKAGVLFQKQVIMTKNIFLWKV